MSIFSIDEAAAAEIRRIFHRSGCLEPVASIYECANAGQTFADVESELLHGSSDTQELSALARKRYSEVADKLEFSLEIDAKERADFHIRYLHEIGGVTFVMDVRLFEMLRNYRLIFVGDRFLFRGADNTEYFTLRSMLESA